MNFLTRTGFQAHRSAARFPFGMCLTILLAMSLFSLPGCQKSTDSLSKGEEVSQTEKGNSQQAASNPNEETPQTENDFLEQANRLFNDGKDKKAATVIDEALKKYPDSFQAKLFKASLLTSQAKGLSEAKSFEEADKLYQQSFELLVSIAENPAPADIKDYVSSMKPYIFVAQAENQVAAENNPLALELLNKAVQQGFFKIDSLEKAEAFAPLVKTEDFAKFKKQTAAFILAKTKQELKDFVSYPFDFELENVEGGKVTKKEFQGKVLVADIWGTWCPPCKEEIPHFIELVKNFDKKDFAMLGLNQESGEPEEVKSTVTTFMKENEINYPCAIVTDEVIEQVPDFQAYPTTLFIDRSGNVRFQLVGLQPYSRLEMIVKILLEEKKQPESEAN